MFGIFKKKDAFTDYDFIFFKAVVSQLPEKYKFLISQLNEEFILGKKPNRLGYEGSFTLLLNANLESKYNDKLLPNLFIIKDVKIWNKVKQSYDFIDLYVLQGMFSGFTIKSKLTDLDYNNVDTAHIREKRFESEDKIELEKIIGNIGVDVRSKLDIESTFRMKINNEIYYVIKDLGDGNYITINRSGAVFFMMHDPYKVEQLFGDKDSFINALNALKFDSFNIQEFYKSQIYRS